MKILFVIGEAGSGKTTFGKMLAEELGCCQVDTSELILKQYEAITGESLPQKEKDRYRPHLINLGDLICSRDPARLVRLILSEVEGPIDFMVICGIRRRVEFYNSIRCVKELGGSVCSVLVVRPGLRAADNFELQDAEAKHVVINNSSIDSLRKVAERVALVEKHLACGVCGARGYPPHSVVCVQCGANLLSTKIIEEQASE